MDSCQEPGPPIADRTSRKQHGIHYTPTRLARFLADQIARNLPRPIPEQFRILDPACGDGALLHALADRLPKRCRPTLIGLETDPLALQAAQARLAAGAPKAKIDLRHQDFLAGFQERVDAVITNPPYVRTQVLGERRAKRLARQFGLRGRLDLYQAFAMAATDSLLPNGTIGLLMSNRFMTVASGADLRKFLLDNLDIHGIFDLGDTRLFQAAVLPLVLVGTRRNAANASVPFVRMQTIPDDVDSHKRKAVQHVLDVFLGSEPAKTVDVSTPKGQVFRVIAGQLALADRSEDRWRLTCRESSRWLNRLESHQSTTFDQLAEIRVGIKTTADNVFIRSSWNDTAVEPELVLPLITHRDTPGWRVMPPVKQVLYPYQRNQQRRVPVQLERYPGAAAYLRSHHSQLASRKYLVQAGREWYEIWVPQRADRWKLPKIVWPDIAATPRFCHDASGAVVNGDCYWLTLKENVPDDWLYLLLGVANSSVIQQFYDFIFHNKLYSGRRRFMTQYVRQFPVPDPDTPGARQIIRLSKKLTQNSVQPSPDMERQLDGLVRESFGLT